MKMMLLCAASILAVSPTLAQNTYPTQAAGVRTGGQVMMLCDAGGVNCRPVTSASPMPIDSGSGATSSQTQGTAPNGSAPMGNPNLVAGSDGVSVRTIRTTGTGNVIVAFGNGVTAPASGAAQGVFGTDAGGVPRPLGVAPYVFNGSSTDFTRSASAADATTGVGLLGAGILGQYQTSLPTYTVGQFGTLAMSARGVLYSSLYGTTGALQEIAPTNGTTRPVRTLGVASFPMMYNGATFDNVPGDTTGGLYTQERERSQYFAESLGIVAAGATIPGTLRNGGASPSQWGTFSCLFRSDVASASNGAQIQGSDDGTNWLYVLGATLSPGVPTRITDRNDFLYHRCALTQGATGNTAAPVVRSSFGQ
jgi:hypothetical protein